MLFSVLKNFLGPEVDDIRWHQDLKPENFLVVSSSTTYPWSFKLADLGLCHFKTIMEGGPEAKDFDAFGTQTYGMLQDEYKQSVVLN